MVNPAFVADVAGVYVVQPIVNDGELDSLPDTVTITAQQGVIACGETVRGTITNPGEQDAYRLSGSAGDVIVITAASEPGSPTYVLAELFSPSGTSMGVSSSNGTIGPIELPDNGTYTVLVRSGNVQVRGFEYGINLQFTKGQCAALISCGQSLSGSMDSAAEQDAYRFSGAAGDAVLITAG